MNQLSKIHLVYRQNNERYAARFEQLYLDRLSTAEQRALALEETTPFVDLDEATVVVVLLDGQAAQDRELKQALSAYDPHGACPIIGVLLHDHPGFEAGTAEVPQVPRALRKLLQKQQLPLYTWSDSSKTIHEWIAVAIGSQPSRA